MTSKRSRNKGNIQNKRRQAILLVSKWLLEQKKGAKRVFIFSWSQWMPHSFYYPKQYCYKKKRILSRRITSFLQSGQATRKIVHFVIRYHLFDLSVCLLKQTRNDMNSCVISTTYLQSTKFRRWWAIKKTKINTVNNNFNYTVFVRSLLHHKYNITGYIYWIFISTSFQYIVNFSGHFSILNITNCDYITLF